MDLLDGNVPSFETMTYSASLAMLTTHDHQTHPPAWRLAGSSMGGYLVARWAQLHPERVDRLVLLCPGFDLQARWPRLVGPAAFRAWERTGTHDVDDGSGTMRALHWEFVVDSRRHPPYPEVECPTLIVHGTRDEIVPVDMSRQYAAGRDHVRLVEVDDDHLLARSADVIVRETEAFFGLA